MWFELERGAASGDAELAARALGGSLWRAARLGDKCAYQELVSGYHRVVLQLALNLTNSEQDALEIHDEVFLRAFVALPQLNGTSLFVWLCRLAVENWLRRLEHQPHPSTGEVRGGQWPVTDTTLRRVPASAKPAVASLAARARWAIRQLTTREYLVFVLKQQQGFNLSTIAEIANTDEEQTRAILDRAFRKLRALLEPPPTW